MLLLMSQTILAIVGATVSPLHLTEYINTNRSDEARQLASVNITELIPNALTQSYAGFFTVNETCNANLFSWFFPADNNYALAPVILWLRGEPGESTMTSIFNEIGPFRMTPKGAEPSKLDSYWSRYHSVLYVDSPVGTGFSYTQNPRCLAESQNDVARDLVTLLVQFYQMFPELRNNPLHIVGQSYAAKFAVTLATAIHNGAMKDVYVNFKGVALGSPWIDPFYQRYYDPMLFQLGLITSAQVTLFKDKENNLNNAINKPNWSRAYELFDEMIFGADSMSLLEQTTGLKKGHNFVDDTQTHDVDAIVKLITSGDFRSLIHVGAQEFNLTSPEVYSKFEMEWAQSVVPQIGQLLSNNYTVLLYNGQLDLICPYATMTTVVNRLNFTRAPEYKGALRAHWRDSNGMLRGYVQRGGGLTHVLVRDAGHYPALDQPNWVHEMIYAHTQGAWQRRMVVL